MMSNPMSEADWKALLDDHKSLINVLTTENNELSDRLAEVLDGSNHRGAVLSLQRQRNRLIQTVLTLERIIATIIDDDSSYESGVATRRWTVEELGLIHIIMGTNDV